MQLDDDPLAFQARAFSDLSDVERVEVLRVPQSTLHGKSAPAGLIHITTASTIRGVHDRHQTDRDER